MTKNQKMALTVFFTLGVMLLTGFTGCNDRQEKHTDFVRPDNSALRMTESRGAMGREVRFSNVSSEQRENEGILVGIATLIFKALFSMTGK